MEHGAGYVAPEYYIAWRGSDRTGRDVYTKYHSGGAGLSVLGGSGGSGGLTGSLYQLHRRVGRLVFRMR